MRDKRGCFSSKSDSKECHNNFERTTYPDFDQESTPLVSGTTVDMRVRGGHEEKIMDFVDRVDNFFRSKRFESTMMDCVSIFLLS
jgi:hypothetical protein